MFKYAKDQGLIDNDPEDKTKKTDFDSLKQTLNKMESERDDRIKSLNQKIESKQTKIQYFDQKIELQNEIQKLENEIKEIDNLEQEPEPTNTNLPVERTELVNFENEMQI